MSGWEIHDPDGGILTLGTVRSTVATTRDARAKLDARLAEHRSVVTHEALVILDDAINDYCAAREREILAKFLYAYEAAVPTVTDA